MKNVLHVIHFFTSDICAPKMARLVDVHSQNAARRGGGLRGNFEGVACPTVPKTWVRKGVVSKTHREEAKERSCVRNFNTSKGAAKRNFAEGRGCASETKPNKIRADNNEDGRKHGSSDN